MIPALRKAANSAVESTEVRQARKSKTSTDVATIAAVSEEVEVEAGALEVAEEEVVGSEAAGVASTSALCMSLAIAMISPLVMSRFKKAK